MRRRHRRCLRRSSHDERSQHEYDTANVATANRVRNVIADRTAFNLPGRYDAGNTAFYWASYHVRWFEIHHKSVGLTADIRTYL